MEWSALATSSGELQVSNPEAPLPISHLDVIPSFLDQDGANRINEILKEAPWTFEGYHGPRRRVWKFSSSDLPDFLAVLCDRLFQCGSYRVTHVQVQEYTPIVKEPTDPSYDPTVLTTFASRKHESETFVAEITLQDNLWQTWNQPDDLNALAWKLASESSFSHVLFPKHTCIVRRQTMVSQWRTSKMMSSIKQGPIRVVQLYNVPSEDRLPIQRDPFGYQPTLESEQIQQQRKHAPVPDLKELLTIVITTSPIKSHPSTEVLERAMATFPFGGSDFMACPILIVCDGVRHTATSKKHSNAKQAMRNGIVDSQQLENYEKFKQNLRHVVNDNTRIVELEERHGYGFALRHAVQNEVKTPFVIVIQHDRTFMRPTPIAEVVETMWKHPNVKYVGLSMRSNLMYRDIFHAKYGQVDEFDDMVLRLPELKVSATQYGPNSSSTQQMEAFIATDKLRKNIVAFAETYKNGSLQNALMEDIVDGQLQMSLVPTLFWYDNVHVCDTAHYADFVYEEEYKMVARGGFVEDKLSPVLKRTVERLGLKEGHSRFGCYLLDDHSGMFFTGHLDGGSYATTEERERLKANYRKDQNVGLGR